MERYRTQRTDEEADMNKYLIELYMIMLDRSHVRRFCGPRSTTMTPRGPRGSARNRSYPATALTYVGWLIRKIGNE